MTTECDLGQNAQGRRIRGALWARARPISRRTSPRGTRSPVRQPFWTPDSGTGDVSPKPRSELRSPCAIDLALCDGHGLIAGAPGTGGRKALQLFAERLSAPGLRLPRQRTRRHQGTASGISAHGLPEGRVQERTGGVSPSPLGSRGLAGRLVRDLPPSTGRVRSTAAAPANGSVAGARRTVARARQRTTALVRWDARGLGREVPGATEGCAALVTPGQYACGPPPDRLRPRPAYDLCRTGPERPSGWCYSVTSSWPSCSPPPLPVPGVVGTETTGFFRELRSWA
ncbi:helicase HerA-like domain-containing protein [Streptomyces albipurpureus]|uniref:DUF853 domain-containing protein n=1 Tax=Streptomyces albipurpureus TaxID=2897419 RepID=A0ABT0US09_9ACTN|nr:helicase HerA-like domain-containing protein [Streptomyces sp. CWNU-1]MCM2391392.1 DUF853 domain-containing protein [Streptomyces sp. CWNU-1]